MRKRSMMFAMILITLALMLPPDLFASGQPGKRGRGRSGSVRLWDDDDRRGRRRYQGRNRYRYGYKNYGQYRRTQVGRRSRLVRRYYWRDGIRLSRFVRVYY